MLKPQKPKWLYSWTWTELDEIRLSSAANELDALANELSSLSESCCRQRKTDLASVFITDAGAHYEDELSLWKQRMDSEVVANLRASASAIRNTVAERQTLWDQFQSEMKKFNNEMKKFNNWLKEQADNLIN